MAPSSIISELADSVDAMSFGDPVTHVYNPLRYAGEATAAYLDRYCRPGVEAMLVGMNPGPWGMSQTGVPFGEVSLVRDWMGIETAIGQPEDEHPKRPVTGFASTRSEVSGARVWGWARDRFGTADAFFDRFFVWNYCPLAFMEESGRNRTPDKLPAREREPLFATCDHALRAMVTHVRPERVLGIGVFAMKRAAVALAESAETAEVEIGTILHPSPASPIANRGWAPQAEAQLRDLGIDLPT